MFSICLLGVNYLFTSFKPNFLWSFGENWWNVLELCLRLWISIASKLWWLLGIFVFLPKVLKHKAFSKCNWLWTSNGFSFSYERWRIEYQMKLWSGILTSKYNRTINLKPRVKLKQPQLIDKTYYLIRH